MIDETPEAMSDAKARLNDEGYVHLERVVSEAAVLRLRDAIDELFEKRRQIKKKYLSRDALRLDDESSSINEINHTVKIQPALKRTEVFRKVRDVAAALLGRRALISFDHAIYKAPGSGVVHWHQDQAYKSSVKAMQSLHFWIPLQETTKLSGGMQYVRYSHKGPVLPHGENQKANGLALESREEWSQQVVACDAKMADVIVHLPRTIHSSLPNNASHVRKAWILHFSPYGYYEVLLPQNLFHRAAQKVKSVGKG